MKKSTIIIIATMLLSTVVFANGENKKGTQTITPQTKVIQQLPYSSTGTAVMQKVYTKNEYTLWKCPSSFISNFPGQSITGINYNYFVYKNGTFHMTVNENNKNDIYQFLTQ